MAKVITCMDNRTLEVEPSICVDGGIYLCLRNEYSMSMSAIHLTTKQVKKLRKELKKLLEVNNVATNI